MRPRLSISSLSAAADRQSAQVFIVGRFVTMCSLAISSTYCTYLPRDLTVQLLYDRAAIAVRLPLLTLNAKQRYFCSIIVDGCDDFKQ